MNLSPNFTLAEFTKSQAALRLKIDNTPPQQAIDAMKLLCEKVLEPTRAHFGKPIILSSGYRSPALNKAIGGAATSDHCFGRAADWEIPGLSNYDVAEWVHRNLNYKQLILECHTPGQPNSGWIHTSYFGPPHKNEELTFDGRKYHQGLVK